MFINPALIDDALIGASRIFRGQAGDLGIAGEAFKVYRSKPGFTAGTARILKAGNPFKAAWSLGVGGAFAPLMFGMSAYQAAHAPRGEKLGTFAGDVTGQVFAGAIGGAIAGWPGAIVANMALTRPIARTVNNLISGPAKGFYQGRSLEMGGDYTDFRAARTMRQRAAQEMSTSLLNARSVLGSEAVFLHS